MNESSIKCQGDLAYEDDDKPTSLISFQLKEILNQTEESGHSSHDHCHLYEVLNPGKAKLAQGSNRALFILVIAVCLSNDPGKNCTIFYCSDAINFPHIGTVVFLGQEFLN